MTKKEKTEKVIHKIPVDKYWEWRTTIEEFVHQKTKLLVIEEQHKTLRALEEASRLRVQIHSVTITKAKSKLEEAEKSYNEFVEKMESELGFSIKGKLIDPYTYEVKDE